MLYVIEVNFRWYAIRLTRTELAGANLAQVVLGPFDSLTELTLAIRDIKQVQRLIDS